MASINPRTKTEKGPLPKTAEGAPAVRVNKTLQLQRLLNACMLWEDNFYSNGVEAATQLAKLVHEVPAEKCAELAIKAREESKLRHAPLLVVREMARGSAAHKALVADTLARVIQRPDEITEFLAIYWNEVKEDKPRGWGYRSPKPVKEVKTKKQPLSNQVKKGLAAATTVTPKTIKNKNQGLAPVESENSFVGLFWLRLRSAAPASTMLLLSDFFDFGKLFFEAVVVWIAVIMFAAPGVKLVLHAQPEGFACLPAGRQ